MREARTGNINRNWFFIFIDCLYKFSPNIRQKIIDFPCSDPFKLAKGKHLFNFLADSSHSSYFFSEEGLSFSDEEAYNNYYESSDETLKAWCLGYELRHSYYEKAFSRLRYLSLGGENIKIIFPFFMQMMGGGLTDVQIGEFAYFFARQKSLEWRYKTLLQRVINRLTMGRFL